MKAFGAPAVATVSDALFLAEAFLFSERGSQKIGIWDLYFNGKNDVPEVSDEAMIKVLENVIATCVMTPVYYKHFSIIKSEEGKNVACCTGYLHPCFNFGSVFRASVEQSCSVVLGWPEEKSRERWKRIAFLQHSFPDVSWNNKFVLDCVYCVNEARGYGLARKVILHCMERSDINGQQDNIKMITCAQGNEVARNLYIKMGFVSRGHGKSLECMNAMGIEGFELLELDKQNRI